ncbi:MAG: hypothetical protein ACOCVR_03975 [Myxococcota bacterium]
MLRLAMATLTALALWTGCARHTAASGQENAAHELLPAEAMVDRIESHIRGGLVFDLEECTIRSDAAGYPMDYVVVPLREVHFEVEEGQHGTGGFAEQVISAVCEEGHCIITVGEGHDSFPPHDRFPLHDRSDRFSFVLTHGGPEEAEGVLEAFRELRRHCP